MSTTPATAPKFNLRNPCLARMTHAARLSGPESPKDTRHFEFSLGGSGMTYEPGDSLAVRPTNCPDLVDEIIATLGLPPDAAVTDLDQKPATLREALLTTCAITQPDRKFLAAVCEKAGSAADSLRPLLDPEKKAELDAFLYGREVIDFLLQYPAARFEPQEFVSLNRKLQIRLYSISSSLRAHPDQVHLTVATVRYASHGRARKGVASTFLTERVNLETTPVPTFINPGKGFRLPAPEEDTPIIMCGPGTGIAPFRAFLQERQVTAARGRAWLFFGEISARSDFFYQQEWVAFQQAGVLHRLSTAFSRDQAEKIYVQHRMREEAAEFWRWLEEGAIFYVCGDASRMALDVDKALHAIIETAGGRTPDQAAAYVEQMKTDKRYRRDVY